MWTKGNQILGTLLISLFKQIYTNYIKCTRCVVEGISKMTLEKKGKNMNYIPLEVWKPGKLKNLSLSWYLSIQLVPCMLLNVSTEWRICWINESILSTKIVRKDCNVYADSWVERIGAGGLRILGSTAVLIGTALPHRLSSPLIGLPRTNRISIL